MGEFLIYSIKAALLLSMLFSIYKLTVGRLKALKLRRCLLLVICFTAIAAPLLPALNISFIDSHSLNENADAFTVILPDAEDSHASTSGVFISNILRVIAYLFVAGTMLTAAYTLYGLAWIGKCLVNSKRSSVGGTNISVVSRPHISPFSFGGRIFISDTDYIGDSEMILCHEGSHVRHRHYLDLLAARVTASLQWWNPLAWMMLRELHAVHEYQADNDVMNAGFAVKDYQYMLLSKVSDIAVSRIANGFGCSSLKQRLLMMNRQPSSIGWRGVLAVPVIIAAVAAISSETLASALEPAQSAFHQAIPSAPDAKIPGAAASVAPVDTLAPSTSESSDSKPLVRVNGKFVSYEYMETINPGDIESITVSKHGEYEPNGLIDITLKSKDTK